MYLPDSGPLRTAAREGFRPRGRHTKGVPGERRRWQRLGEASWHPPALDAYGEVRLGAQVLKLPDDELTGLWIQHAHRREPDPGVTRLENLQRQPAALQYR